MMTSTTISKRDRVTSTDTEPNQLQEQKQEQEQAVNHQKRLAEDNDEASSNKVAKSLVEESSSTYTCTTTATAIIDAISVDANAVELNDDEVDGVVVGVNEKVVGNNTSHEERVISDVLSIYIGDVGENVADGEVAVLEENTASLHHGNSRGGINQKQNEKWVQRLNELRQYKEKYGDCMVPRYYEATPGLGSWIHNQRTQYKLYKAGIHSRINPERVELLELVGFVWDAREQHSLNTKPTTSDIEAGNASSNQKQLKRQRRPQDTKWLKKFEELCQYKEKFGNTLVPQSFIHSPSLGKWVSYQRSQYKLWMQNLPTQLSQERRNLLESIGFVWLARDPDDTLPWDVRFHELKQYKAEFGTCLVPRSYRQLGAWVHYQRQQYRLMKRTKTSQMNVERVSLLEAEGFQWNVQGHRPWEARLEELRAFKVIHGNCLVPIKYPPNPQLGNWVHNQRKEYKMYNENKKSSLTSERICMLQAEGFVWDTRNSVESYQHQPNLFASNTVTINDALAQDAILKSDVQLKDIMSAPNLRGHSLIEEKDKLDREEPPAWGV